MMYMYCSVIITMFESIFSLCSIFCVSAHPSIPKPCPVLWQVCQSHQYFSQIHQMIHQFPPTRTPLLLLSSLSPSSFFPGLMCVCYPVTTSSDLSAAPSPYGFMSSFCQNTYSRSFLRKDTWEINLLSHCMWVCLYFIPTLVWLCPIESAEFSHHPHLFKPPA